MSIADDPRRPAGTGPQRCAAIASTMIGHFLTRLELEARQSGGMLSIEQINAVASRFVADDGARLRSVQQKSWDGCTEAREAAAWEHARRQPFDRLLTKRFAHLLPARSGDDGGAAAVLSRRMLPGFAKAVTMMLGPDLYEQCQRKAQAVVERQRRGAGAVDWSRVHRDPAARALVNDVLVVVAHYFAAFEKRRGWFILLVNQNLGPSRADADDRWQLTVPLFHKMMLALFAEVFGLLEADQGQEIRARYGQDTVETLLEFRRHINGLS